MGQQPTDPNGTLVEAQRLGLSRRTIQRRQKKLREAAAADMQALVPQQQVLPLVPINVQPLRMPRAQRISALQAAARAGALEKAVFERLKQAVEKGDVAAVKLFSASWKDILTGVQALEKMAEEVLRIRRWQERERQRNGTAY